MTFNTIMPDPSITSSDRTPPALLPEHALNLMYDLGSLPDRRRWALWRLEPSGTGSGLVVVSPRTGETIDQARAQHETLGDFYQALLAYEDQTPAPSLGLGYLPEAQDELGTITLQRCFDPVTGALLPWAEDLVKHFQSYTEHWRGGLRIVVRADCPPCQHVFLYFGRPVVFDTRPRFLPFTGRVLEAVAGNPIRQRTRDFTHVLGQLVGRQDGKQAALRRLSARPKQHAWPEPPGEAAWHGLAGRVVRLIDPYTEGDPVAVLMQFLLAFGVAAGSTPTAFVGADKHQARDYTALVGRSSAGKGNAWSAVCDLLTWAEADFDKRLRKGLSSGEGLIWSLRDAVYKNEPGKTNDLFTDQQPEIADAGVQDKRALVIEPELKSVLAVMDRQGNILSPLLRDGWDSGNLSTLTKNSPARVTGAHIGLIGHITPVELQNVLSAVDLSNGFAGRFIWLAVKRSKELPDPPAFTPDVAREVVREIQAALQRARTIQTVTRDEDAKQLWNHVYSSLTADRPGVLGDITAKAAAHVLRLSLIYALLDQSEYIRVPHLVAALELWGYAERSAAHLFSTGTIARDTRKLYDALREAGDAGLTRKQILGDVFKNNKTAEQIDRKLGQLEARGLVRKETRPTGGRSAEVWVVTDREDSSFSSLVRTPPQPYLETARTWIARYELNEQRPLVVCHA